MHGYEQLGPVESQENVLILGSGPLGLYSLAVARDRGARKVLMIGAPDVRLAVAREWGADDVLDLDATPDVNHRIAWVREHTDGRGADIVFQCATSAVVAEGLEMARPGGRLVSIGVGGGPVTPSPVIFVKHVRINRLPSATSPHLH